MKNRREQLGRNRKVAGPNGTNWLLFAGVMAICVATWFAYQWFANPARVFGARALDCGVFEIQITPRQGDMRVIEGCGKQVVARCTEEGCVAEDDL